MASTNAPYGFAAVRYLNGSPYNGAGNLYYIASDDVNAFALGDPVKSSGTADTNGVAGVTLGTAGSPLRGIIVAIGTGPAGSTGTGKGQGPGGAYGDPTNPATIIIPATKTKAYYVLVADDPFIIFSGQEVNSGTPWTADEIGLNANFVAGTNNGYVSGATLNNATEAVTATLNFRILGLLQIPGNTYMAGTPPFVTQWLVLMNDHELKVGSLGLS